MAGVVIVRRTGDDEVAIFTVEEGLEAMNSLEGHGGSLFKLRAADASRGLHNEATYRGVCRQLGGPEWPTLSWQIVDENGGGLADFSAPQTPAADAGEQADETKQADAAKG